MADEEFTDWVQLDDVDIVLLNAASNRVEDADAYIPSGYASSNAPFGTMTWQRSFGGDYPQTSPDALTKAWDACRHGPYGAYYYNSYGPYQVDPPFGSPVSTPPGLSSWGSSVPNHNGDNQANNALSHRFTGSTFIGGFGTLHVEVSGSAMAHRHAELLAAAGPFGDGVSAFPTDPVAYFADYFAAGAAGRTWEVQYEDTQCSATDVKVRCAEVSEAAGGTYSTPTGLSPLGATWFYAPMRNDYDHPRPSWGNYWDTSLGFVFHAGTSPEQWYDETGALLLGTNVVGGWISIDWESAVAAEASTYRGYSFMVVPTVWMTDAVPFDGTGLGLDFDVETHRPPPLIDFKLTVRPVRFRAHYFADTDPPPTAPEPTYGEVRGQFLR